MLNEDLKDTGEIIENILSFLHFPEPTDTMLRELEILQAELE